VLYFVTFVVKEITTSGAKYLPKNAQRVKNIKIS